MISTVLLHAIIIQQFTAYVMHYVYYNVAQRQDKHFRPSGSQGLRGIPEPPSNSTIYLECPKYSSTPRQRGKIIHRSREIDPCGKIAAPRDP